MRLFRRRPAVPAAYAHLREEDREVLAALVAGGADLTRPRCVVHLGHYPGEPAARAAAAELADAGWAVTVSASPASCLPLAEVTARDPQRTLTPAVVDGDARLFAAVLARHGGLQHRWSASV